MIKKIFFLVLVLFAVACQDVDHVEKPNDLIAEDKMVAIIAEISLMQSARNFNKRIYERTGVKAEEHIFEKYDVDSLQIKRSNEYYTDNYTVYQRIYDSVKSRLEQMKTALDTLEKQEQRMKDSIAQVKRDSISEKDSDPELEKPFEEISDSLIEQNDAIETAKDSFD